MLKEAFWPTGAVEINAFMNYILVMNSCILRASYAISKIIMLLVSREISVYSSYYLSFMVIILLLK